MSADNLIRRLRDPSTEKLLRMADRNEAADLIERQQRQIAAYKNLMFKAAYMDNEEINENIHIIEAIK